MNNYMFVNLNANRCTCGWKGQHIKRRGSPHTIWCANPKCDRRACGRTVTEAVVNWNRKNAKEG